MDDKYNMNMAVVMDDYKWRWFCKKHDCLGFLITDDQYLLMNESDFMNELTRATKSERGIC